MDETLPWRGCAICCHALRLQRDTFPLNFDERVVLQFLREGYSGQAPVNENELNLCLVGKPSTISRLRQWAQRQFEIPANQRWRTITPLTRSPVPCANENLLFVG